MFCDSQVPSQRDVVAPFLALLGGLLLGGCGSEPDKALFRSSSAAGAGAGNAAGIAAGGAGGSAAGAAGAVVGGAAGAAGGASGGGVTGAAGSAGAAQSAGASAGGASGGGAPAQAGSGGAGGAVDCLSLSAKLGALKSDSQYCELTNTRATCTGFVKNHCGCKLAVDVPDSKVAKDYQTTADLVAKECAPDCSAARLCTSPTIAVCKTDPATMLGRCEGAD